MAKFGCFFASAVAAAMGASSAAPAQEVTVSGGAVAGKILSHSVAGVPTATTATVLTVPKRGRFVLTLICSGFRGEIPFNGSIFGFIAQTPPAGGSGSCQSLLPGVALNPGEDITCTDPGGFPGGISCQASGVLSKR